jgi:thiosulfate/3-mercaptopyruvate sulfurtransferase
MPVSLISPLELTLLLQAKPTVSIIDARGKQEHEKGHIPNAVPLSWEDWSARPPAGCSSDLREPGYWGELADPHHLDFECTFSTAGISNQVPVVVYADGAGSKGREGRIAWMLLYLGAAKIYILNGGLAAWLRAGGELSREETPVTPGKFKVKLQHHRRITLPELQHRHITGNLPRSVDTRLLMEFQGLSYDYQPRPGHMPNATQLTYENLFEDDGQFVQQTRFFSLVPQAVLQAKEVFTYCEVGVRASTYALLYEAYTGKVMPVYDGSIMEWGLHSKLPVLQGS